MSQSFPPTFQWGAATAGYQIEGATETDGRKPGVWDTFSAQPGRVMQGDTGAIACDHYHRYPEDLQLLADLGVQHYRLSIAWPRILPDGTGLVNDAGLAFYQRLIDGLLAHGITPHVTLFHWDSPQALEDRYGSWRSRQMAHDFADYVTVVVQALGDRVTHWMTLNEIFCFTHLGYGVNQMPPHAPGTVVASLKEVWQTSHHALLAHSLGCQAIRAASPQPCTVALVDNFLATVPLTETPADIAAAQQAFPTVGTNGGIIFPALTGEYSAALLAQLGDQAPDIAPGDLATIISPSMRWDSMSTVGFTCGRLTMPPVMKYCPFLRAIPDCTCPGCTSCPRVSTGACATSAPRSSDPTCPLSLANTGVPPWTKSPTRAKCWTSIASTTSVNICRRLSGPWRRAIPYRATFCGA